MINQSSFFLQLLPHWEKIFGIDLSHPQIGVIDADDVSNIFKRPYYLLGREDNFLQTPFLSVTLKAPGYL